MPRSSLFMLANRASDARATQRRVLERLQLLLNGSEGFSFTSVNETHCFLDIGSPSSLRLFFRGATDVTGEPYIQYGYLSVAAGAMAEVLVGEWNCFDEYQLLEGLQGAYQTPLLTQTLQEIATTLEQLAAGRARMVDGVVLAPSTELPVAQLGPLGSPSDTASGEGS